MNHKNVEPPEFKYTNSFLKKKKLQKILEYFVFLISMSITLYINLQSRVEDYLSFVSFLSSLVYIGSFIRLFCFREAFRNFNADKIYINDGFLHYEKCRVYRNSNFYKEYTVKNVEKIDVSPRYIKIYGVILYYNERKYKLRNMLKLSAEIVNVDELISYLKSIQVTDSQVIADSLNEFHGKKANTYVGRAMIWASIRKAFISLISKKVLVGCVSVAVGLLCIFVKNNVFDSNIFDMLQICFIDIGLIFLFLGFYTLISEFLFDLIFKRVLIYEGCITAIEPVKTTYDTTSNPIKQYKGYYHVIFYSKPNVKDKQTQLSLGDIKRNPNGGQSFLLKDKTMFVGARVDQTFEVLYLKKSKIIVAAKRTVKVKQK